MCIVTFIPLRDKVFITHNRDELRSRARALPPAVHTVNGYTLLFPEDGAAHGTWIACNKNGSAAVLLNGAFEKHLPQPPYRKSRGLAFLDIMAAGDVYFSYCNTDLTGIEPFTIIIWSNSKLYECRWDGERQYIAEPSAAEPHTWSSVTLYDQATRAKRKTWFRNWLLLHPAPSMEQIMRFHLHGGEDGPYNDLRMNRDGKLLTVSVTAMEITKNNAMLKYMDLQDDTSAVQEFIFTKTAALQK